MIFSRKDEESFKILKQKLKSVNSEGKITEFIQFVKDNQFSSAFIQICTSYQHSSIMSMALTHDYEPLTQRLMIEQFSIESNDRIYHLDKLIRNYHFYDDFNQNNAMCVMIKDICNRSLGLTREDLLQMFDDLKQVFDSNQISIKKIKVNYHLFSLVINLSDSQKIHLKENSFLMDIIQQGIKNNVTPKSKTQLNVLKNCGFFDMYADHIKKQLLIAELLNDGEELIITDTINCDIDAGINII